MSTLLPHNISIDGLNATRMEEGRALRAYRDAVGVWTVLVQPARLVQTVRTVPSQDRPDRLAIQATRDQLVTPEIQDRPEIQALEVQQVPSPGLPEQMARPQLSRGQPGIPERPRSQRDPRGIPEPLVPPAQSVPLASQVQLDIPVQLLLSPGRLERKVRQVAQDPFP